MRPAVPVLESDPFAAIRSGAAFVAEHARHVRIDAARLRAYASEVPAGLTTQGREGPWTRMPRDPEPRCAFVLALDAVNFGSGFFPHLRKRPGASGYRTIEASLVERFARAPLRAEELREITAAECAEIFGQTLTAPIDELMQGFARAWRELGELVQRDFGGRFAALVYAADGRAANLVSILLGLELFRDVETYQGRAVPFLKRAQIAAADLNAALWDLDARSTFSDLEQMTLFADNLVPHVLRLDGVLAFDPALIERIEREEVIPIGSDEEIEIRGCAVHAVEQLSLELRGRDVMLWPYQLDDWLWNRGGGPTYKARPRHRSRSWYY